MSILIKGMEMPINCVSCKVAVTVKDGMLCTPMFRLVKEEKILSERPQDCPLIEVPTPHGDLIDINALTHEYYKKASYSHLCDCLNNAPTIIESEDD